MLLFTLSSIASNRRKQWDEKTGSATTIALPGLPELLCLEIGIIRVPDEDLYGLSVSNSSSGRRWKLDHAPAVGDPTHMVEFGTGRRAFAREA